MKTLIQVYRYYHKATEQLVKLYSPHISLKHLNIKDNATEGEIIKNMKELRDFSDFPQYSYLINKKND